jgi:TonB family protein
MGLRVLLRSAFIGGTLSLAAATARAQSISHLLGDPNRRLQKTIQIVDELALQDWTLQIFARRDGWVELDLESISRQQVPLPWLVSDRYRGKMGSPVRTRAYFTPDEIRHATSFADSLIDKTIPQDSAAKRFSRGAPTFLSMSGRSGERWTQPLFNWYMFPPRSHAPAGVSPNTDDAIEFGLGTCLTVGDAAVAFLGRGVTRSVAEYRSILRALDSAAIRAARYSSPARALKADLIDADEAACLARPHQDVPRPAYPTNGAGRSADVHLDAVVDTAGRIDPASVRVMMSADSLFDHVAADAIARWRFYPAMLTAGTPVAQRIHIHIHFAPKPLGNEAMDALMDAAAVHGAEVLVISRTPGETGNAP